MFTPESLEHFANNSSPLFLKKNPKPSQDLENLNNELEQLSEPARNALKEFIKWRESVVKEYEKRAIPMNVLEKYVPFVFVRKGSTDEMETLSSLFGTGSLPDNQDISSLINWLSGADPNILPRTTKATDPTQINKFLKKPILSEDAGAIMSLRGTRAIQAQELYDFAEEFSGKYGMSIEEMASYKNLKGYKAYTTKVGSDGRRIFQEASSNSVISGKKEIQFLPEEMVNIYNQYTDMVFGKQNMNNLLRTYDKATSIYKKLAYLWNPGHIARDFSGNVYNGYLKLKALKI
jgi:hypothetical protein